MTNTVVATLIAVAVPIAGAVGYVHGTFATKARVEKVETAIERVDKIVCKMAIRQQIENAEDICTE